MEDKLLTTFAVVCACAWSLWLVLWITVLPTIGLIWLFGWL